MSEGCDRTPLASGEEQTVGSEDEGEGTREEATATIQERGAGGLGQEGSGHVLKKSGDFTEAHSPRRLGEVHLLHRREN